MEDQDAEQVARWVNAGRREGRFVGSPTVNADDHRRYARQLTRQGFKQHWLIVELHGKASGYLNLAVRRGTGEILGIYLEPGVRGSGLGAHLLRGAVGLLREAGCREVQAHIFADNHPALRAAHHAGFRDDPARQDMVDKRKSLLLRQALTPWQRLSPKRQSYLRVQGQNVFFHHVALAEALIGQFAAVPGALAILGQGSLARGFADSFSDLDLVLVGKGLSRLPWRGERWLAGVSVDLYAVDLQSARPEAWGSVCKQAFQESVVLWSSAAFDLRAFSDSLALKRRERRDALCELIFKMGWLGFSPSRWFGKVVRGYHWSLPHDLWLRRGSLASAHTTVDRVLDYLLELLFFLNGERPPDAKWRRYLVTDLSFTPPGFAKQLDRVERTARDERGFAARAKALRACIDATIEELEARGDLAANLYPTLLRVSAEYQSDI
jgi:RimJ/RimL family protein N-acetyltransferase